MFENPLTAIRLLANVALVGMLVAFTMRVLSGGPGPLATWVWATGGIAIAGAVVQFVASFLYSPAIRPAWDEQVVQTHTGSYAFGYWMLLLAFLALFLATQFAGLSTETAFLLLAPILAATPSIYMIVATIRGRAG